MELHNRNIHNFLYDRRYKQKIPGWIKCPVETNYFKILNDNMIKNSEKRIESIKIRIINDINKNNFTKKYQISSKYEYNILSDFCKTLNIDKYELLWCHDMNLERNKLDKISEGDYSCCKDCDSPMVFINKKIPVRYCYFYKT